MSTYSTAQVATVLGVERATLYRWMRERKVPRPVTRRIGGVLVRLWTEKDVEKVRRYKAKFYWTGQGRKKGKKSKP